MDAMTNDPAVLGAPPLVLERRDSQAIVDAITHALTSVKLDPTK